MRTFFLLLAAVAGLCLHSALLADESGDGLEGLVSLLNAVDDEAFQLDLLKGMADALKGRTNVPPPKGWEAVAAKLTKNGNEAIRNKVAELSLQFGDQAALKKLVAQATNRDLAPAERIRAVRLLVQKRAEALKPLVANLLSEPEMRAAAIEALAALDSPADARKLIDGFSQFSNEEQQLAIAALCSRISYARLLIEAIEAGRVPARDVSAYHARQLQSFNDSDINRRLKVEWGELRSSSAENREQIDRLLKVMSPEFIAKADLSHGRRLFKKTCASCHKLFDDGGAIGPNLTGSNRNNLLYVLENVIDPSAAVARDYTVTMILTEDGRKLSGIVGRTTDRTIEVQTLQEKLVLDRSEIELMKPSTQSMMPEGLTEKMSDADIRDLVGYLRSEQQVESGD